MAMSGICVSSVCEEAHKRQVNLVKDVQWTIYKISVKECHDHDDDHEQEMQQKQQKKGKKDSDQEITVDRVKTRSFVAQTACDCKLDADKVKEIIYSLWVEFVNELPAEESRYAVFDYVLPTKSGTFIDKIRFVAWSPDSQAIKTKMVYSSTKDYLKKKLDIRTKETFLSSKNQEDIDDCFRQLMEA